MMRSFFTIYVVIVVFGCNQYRQEEARLETGREKHKKTELITRGDFSEADLTEKISKVSLRGARNIGEFFDHRLVFYQVDYPNIKFGRAQVEEMVFYFIDSSLVKLRYKIKDNVSDYLLDSLGLSRFKPLDEYSKQQLEKGSIVKKFGGVYELNRNLTNYELVWRERNTVSRFRVQTADSLMTCFYYHELDGYEAKIRELEQLYYALDNSIDLD